MHISSRSMMITLGLLAFATGFSSASWAARSRSAEDAAAAALEAATAAADAAAEMPDCGPADAGCGVDPGAATDDSDYQMSDAAPAESAIDAPFGNAWLGAADGDVTLVVFADYACPACREAQGVIDELLAADKRLKVVYRILVNEEHGRDAAMVSLAVAQSKADWGKFHRALDAGGDPTDASIAAALRAVGLDRRSLSALKDIDPYDGPIANELRRNDSFIYEREGTAVPAYVIGDSKALNGFDLATLRSAIATARGTASRR